MFLLFAFKIIITNHKEVTAHRVNQKKVPFQEERESKKFR